MFGLYTTFMCESLDGPKHVVVISSQIVGGWKAFDTHYGMMKFIRETTKSLSRFGELEYLQKGEPDHRINSIDEYAFCQYKYLQRVRASKTIGWGLTCQE